MKLAAIELRRIKLPLVAPFRTSFGVEDERDILLVSVETPDAEGWGECVAGSQPLYSSEFADGAQYVLEHFLIPRLLELPDVDGYAVGPALRAIKGHAMAKAAIEMAIIDAQLRSGGISFASFIGGVCPRVDCGVSVGIHEDIGQLLDTVRRFLSDGYKRIKLKIEPGHDLEQVEAVRTEFGDDLMLQVDANTAYTLADSRHLAELDRFDLLLIEQPLPEDDVRGHAELAKTVRTPICLDESITSSRAAADAIALGACSIVNIKAGRVGGYLEARRIHDVCAANGIPVWCGGMLESGIGRAANVALASLPNFTLPGDTSASARYFERDVTQPFVLQDGTLEVPTGAGLGVTPIPEILEEVTTSTTTIGA